MGLELKAIRSIHPKTGDFKKFFSETGKKRRKQDANVSISCHVRTRTSEPGGEYIRYLKLKTKKEGGRVSSVESTLLRDGPARPPFLRFLLTDQDGPARSLAPLFRRQLAGACQTALPAHRERIPFSRGRLKKFQ